MAVEVLIYVLGGLILGDREVGKRKKLLFNKPTENLELTICFHRKKWVLHVLKKCLDLCWLCCSQTAWLDFVFHFSLRELVLEVCCIHCIHFCVGKWGPNVQISCLTPVCSVWEHRAQAVQGWPEPWLASWQESCQGAAAGSTIFCLPSEVGPLQEHFLWHQAVLKVPWETGSEPWEHYSERQGQTEGRVPKSYVRLDKSRLRSCGNEIRAVHRSNHVLGWVFFSCFGFCFVLLCGVLLVCDFYFFFSFILCKCLIKVQKGSLC